MKEKRKRRVLLSGLFILFHFAISQMSYGQTTPSFFDNQKLSDTDSIFETITANGFSEPLDDETLLLMKKSLHLTDPQMNEITLLSSLCIKANKIAKGLWNITHSTSKSLRKDRINQNDINEKQYEYDSSKKTCLMQIIELKKLLGSKFGDFVFWVGEEDWIRVNVSQVFQKNRNVSSDISENIRNDYLNSEMLGSYKSYMKMRFTNTTDIQKHVNDHENLLLYRVQYELAKQSLFLGSDLKKRSSIEARKSRILSQLDSLNE